MEQLSPILSEEDSSMEMS